MKKIYFLKLATIASCLMTSMIVHANPKSEVINNGCHELDVQVLNKTDGECILMSYRMEHGYIESVIPNGDIVPANATQTFVTRQNLVQGPTIELTYLCAGKKVFFESHQNFCLLEAGSISGHMKPSSPNIYATYIKNTGSFSWSYPGHIYWALETKN